MRYTVCIECAISMDCSEHQTAPQASYRRSREAGSVQYSLSGCRVSAAFRFGGGPGAANAVVDALGKGQAPSPGREGDFAADLPASSSSQALTGMLVTKIGRVA
jgi:hypothetical protein